MPSSFDWPVIPNAKRAEFLGRAAKTQFPWLVDDAAETALKEAKVEERRLSEAKMAWDFANLHMPEDLRQRAEAWGMSAFCELLWNNAFQAGYREALHGKDSE